MRGLEIQLRVRARVIPTREGRALTFTFALGPIKVFVIANIPGEEGEGPLVYIKMNLKADEGWQIFKEHEQRGVMA